MGLGWALFDKTLIRGLFAAAALLASSLTSGCRSDTVPPVERDGVDSLGLNSTGLLAGRFPASMTCDGANTSPDLAWNPPPAGTKSFALILHDRDAPGGGFVHWVLFNLPPQSRSLPASFSALPELPNGTRQGSNDFDQIGYGGPCPNGSHHYTFVLLALDTDLNLPSGSTRAQLDEAMKGHVRARGWLVATYSR